MYVYVCIITAIHQKLAQHYKSALLQFKYIYIYKTTIKHTEKNSTTLVNQKHQQQQQKNQNNNSKNAVSETSLLNEKCMGFLLLSLGFCQNDNSLCPRLLLQ